MKGVLLVLFIISLGRLRSTESKDFGNALPATLPEGYSIYPGHNVAYKIYHVSSTWDEARARCVSDGGDLAIADTSEKIYHIQKMDSLQQSWILVGIYKPAGSRLLKTVANVELFMSSVPWARPNHEEMLLSDKSCLAIVFSLPGLWDYSCSDKVEFACEIKIDEDDYTPTSASTTSDASTTETPTTRPITPQTSANLDFADGYQEFPRFRTAYKMYEENVTQHEARRRCFSDGGRLAVVDTFEKINAVRAILRGKSVHIGIRMSSVHSEEWVVDSDGQSLKDLPWTPENAHPKKCAAIKEDGSGLVETLCSNRLPALCEIRHDNY